MSAQAAGPSQPAAPGPSRGLGLTFAATRCAGRRRHALRRAAGAWPSPPGRSAPAALGGCKPRLPTPPAALPTRPPFHRLEEVYLVYTAEKNRGLTLRLHFMLVAAWAVGALKTLSQLMLAFQQ